MEALLKNLKNNTYCIIDRSDISGVGVFAIRVIPIGIDPFVLADGKSKQYDIIEMSKKDLKGIPKSVMNLLDKYFLIGDDEDYPIISNGLNDMDMSFYINHSDTPNIESVESDDNDLLEFRTIKKIKKGEELLLNYNAI